MSDERKAKKAKALRLLPLVFVLASCGSYAKAITIDAAKAILSEVVAYAPSAVFSEPEYRMQWEVTTSKDDVFSSEVYASHSADIVYRYDGSVSDPDATFSLSYAETTLTAKDSAPSTVTYLVTRANGVYYVSQDGGAKREYQAATDSFLASYFDLPTNLIRQDSLAAANYALGLLSSIGTPDESLANTLTSYSTISSGGDDLLAEFEGTGFEFGSLFAETKADLTKATSFSAHFGGGLLSSMEAKYGFTVEESSSSSLPSGNFVLAAKVAFGV